MEIYREIKGYENYLISNYGNVYSMDRNIKMSPGLMTSGYLFVNLGGKRGKKFSIHRLVAQAFIPNPQYKPTVNHKDGVKTNNHFSNLEWMTYSENERHAWENGLKKTSSKRIAKISKPVNQYDMDGNLINRFDSITIASRSVGVDGSGISKCCRGKMRHIGGYLWEYA